MGEIVYNFFDRLKSVSSGYASLSYEHKEFVQSNIIKVVFHLNDEPVDALAFLVHESRAKTFSTVYAKKLKDLLPS